MNFKYYVALFGVHMYTVVYCSCAIFNKNDQNGAKATKAKTCNTKFGRMTMQNGPDNDYM